MEIEVRHRSKPGSAKASMLSTGKPSESSITFAESERFRTKLLTVVEVSKILHCGTSTIWRWAKQGRIPRPIRICGATRWKLDEVLAVISAAEFQRDTAK